MDRNAKEIRYAVLSCLFAALIAIGAFIAIPLPVSPVPIVLQTMFILLAALVLGPWWGSLSTVLYLVLGLFGLPVFSGGAGGLAVFLGPTGGYLLGYIPCSILTGLLSRKAGGKKIILAAACLAGMVPIYALGLLRLKAVLGSGWERALIAGVLPFLPGDSAKIILAATLAPKLSSGISALAGESYHG